MSDSKKAQQLTGAPAEPSMEEILASIRRILKEDEGAQDEAVSSDASLRSGNSGSQLPKWRRSRLPTACIVPETAGCRLLPTPEPEPAAPDTPKTGHPTEHV